MMNCGLRFLMMVGMVAASQIHIANDDYLMEKVREKRDATSCANGMATATRNVFLQTIANGKTWDCTLEQKAQAVIKECLLDNGGATKGTLKLSFPLTDNTVTPDAMISQNKNALGLATSNLNSQNVTVQVKESIGCSIAKCDQRVDILCLYGSSTPKFPSLP